MKNIELDQRTRRDIDGQIVKILRGLGDPAPPIDLRLVRDLLKLDRGYYSTTDDSFLRATVPAACEAALADLPAAVPRLMAERIVKGALGRLRTFDLA